MIPGPNSITNEFASYVNDTPRITGADCAQDLESVYSFPISSNLPARRLLRCRSCSGFGSCYQSEHDVLLRLEQRYVENDVGGACANVA
jgi:hypothetical protein